MVTTFDVFELFLVWSMVCLPIAFLVAYIFKK